MSRTAATDRHAIHSDTPLRLADAVEIAFPSGGMTVSGLRREIARGRLEAELIAGKHFVTLAAIQQMRQLCRVRVDCCGWIHQVPIGPHAHARPDQTGAQFAARLVCRKCGKRPDEYRIERRPTYGYTADLSNLLSYRPRRD